MFLPCSSGINPPARSTELWCTYCVLGIVPSIGDVAENKRVSTDVSLLLSPASLPSSTRLLLQPLAANWDPRDFIGGWKK